MTNEPQNQGEQWLKAYAQQRRAEAAQSKPELHPATRRLLQSEVARTHVAKDAAFATSTASPVASIESVGLFGRWAFNALALAAVGVVAAVLGVIISDAPRTKPAQFAGTPKPVGEILKLEKSSETESVLTWTIPTRKAAGESTLANTVATATPAANAPIAPTAPPKLDGVASAGAGGGAASSLAKASAQPTESASAPAPADSSSTSNPKVRLTSRAAMRSATGEPLATASGKLDKAPSAVATSVAVKEKESATKADALIEPNKNLMAAKKAAALGGSITPVAPAASSPVQAGLVAGLAESKQKLGEANAEGQAMSRLQQNFSQSAARDQAYRRNLNAPGEPRVLVNFQLEREGNVVRVVDGDGSIYLGNVAGEVGRKLAPDTRRKDVQNVPAKREELDRALQLDQEQAKSLNDGFNFQVVGTNRSLRQRVVFEGNYQNYQTQGLELKGAAFKDTTNQLSRSNKDAKQQSQQSPVGAPRVQGRAVIGGNRIEVDAVPVSK